MYQGCIYLCIAFTFNSGQLSALTIYTSMASEEGQIKEKSSRNKKICSTFFYLTLLGCRIHPIDTRICTLWDSSTSILKTCKQWYVHGTLFSGTTDLTMQYILRVISHHIFHNLKPVILEKSTKYLCVWLVIKLLSAWTTRKENFLNIQWLITYIYAAMDHAWHFHTCIPVRFDDKQGQISYGKLHTKG